MFKLIGQNFKVKNFLPRLTYSKLQLIQMGNTEMSLPAYKASLTNRAFIIFSSSFRLLLQVVHCLKSSGLATAIGGLLGLSAS